MQSSKYLLSIRVSSTDTVKLRREGQHTACFWAPVWWAFAHWLVSTVLYGLNKRIPWKLAFMCSKTQNGEKHRFFVNNTIKSIGWTLYLIVTGSLNYHTFRYISKVDGGSVHCCWVPNQVMLPFKFHMNFGWKGHKCIPNILSNMKCEPNFNSFWQLNSLKIVGYICKAACFDLVMRFMFF